MVKRNQHWQSVGNGLTFCWSIEPQSLPCCEALQQRYLVKVNYFLLCSGQTKVIIPMAPLWALSSVVVLAFAETICGCLCLCWSYNTSDHHVLIVFITLNYQPLRGCEGHSVLPFIFLFHWWFDSSIPLQRLLLIHKSIWGRHLTAEARFH